MLFRHEVSSAIDQLGGEVVTEAAGQQMQVVTGLERAMGFEPTAFCLGSKHSTTKLPLLRQAVYGRLAGYEDTNDAERLVGPGSACLSLDDESRIRRPRPYTREQGLAVLSG